MDEIKKMLQTVLKDVKLLKSKSNKTDKMLRAVINGQSKLKADLLKRIDKVGIRVDKLEKKVDDGFKGVNDRLDKQGKQLAYLEDDVPTIKEHDSLEKRVNKIEHKIASM